MTHIDKNNHDECHLNEREFVKLSKSGWFDIAYKCTDAVIVGAIRVAEYTFCAYVVWRCLRYLMYL